MIRFQPFLALTLLLFISPAQSDTVLWERLNYANKGTQAAGLKDDVYRLDMLQLRQRLSRAGVEGRARSTSEIELPVEDGRIQRFLIEESPIMAPELAAKYPEIKTYKVRGIDDPLASGRLSIGSKGFHGMISNASGVYYIDPDADDRYRGYARKSQMPTQPFSCGVKGHDHSSPLSSSVQQRPALRTAGSLQVYRLAVAGTAQYVTAVGGTVNAAQNAVVTAINRVNEIYERDLGVRLQLVANNDLLMFLDPVTDGYTNNDGNAMLSQNQAIIDNIIGFNNYDIGHVFSTDGGGIAQVASVCSTTVSPFDGTGKASGVTGLLNPTGERFYIDFVAHEIGHQFSAEHTFNGTTDSCGGGRIQQSAFEPGSGSTIMAYASICGAENIASRSDALFHAGSIQQIDAFTTTGGARITTSCGSTQPLFNAFEPTVDTGNASYTIPQQTAFVLSATGADLDNDSLSYSWDQMDTGTATSATTLGRDLTTNPLFRSYLPRAENYRHFPALGTTLQNKYDKSEMLPCQSRNLNFRATVRDGNGGIGRDDVTISVDSNAGPFAVTSFNSAQTISSGSQTVTWDVAGTNQAPVNCSQVDISLLTFNATKTSYAETALANSVANAGSAVVTLPSQFSDRARIKVQCSDNVFYDISDADLTITGGVPFSTTGNTVFYNGNTSLLSDAPVQACSSNADESNDSFATATTISFNTGYNFAIQGFTDFDYFQVSVPSSGSLNVVTSGTTDTRCTLFASNDTSNVVIQDDDSGTDFNCSFTQAVSAGSYYIVVDGFTDGPYTLVSTFASSSGSGSGGGGSVDQRWLVWLLLLAMLRLFIVDTRVAIKR